MAGKKRQKIRPRDITGLKFFDRLSPLLERLHDAGCDRDKAGNRTLHYRFQLVAWAIMSTPTNPFQAASSQ